MTAVDWNWLCQVCLDCAAEREANVSLSSLVFVGATFSQGERRMAIASIYAVQPIHLLRS